MTTGVYPTRRDIFEAIHSSDDLTGYAPSVNSVVARGAARQAIIIAKFIRDHGPDRQIPGTRRDPIVLLWEACRNAANGGAGFATTPERSQQSEHINGTASSIMNEVILLLDLLAADLDGDRKLNGSKVGIRHSLRDHVLELYIRQKEGVLVL